MTFYVENNTDYEFPFDTEELLKKLVDAVIKYFNLPYTDLLINLEFTDDEGIREVNREFRDIDKATDVLSFPAIDYLMPLDFSYVKDNEIECFDPDTKDLIFGDIMISTDHVISQAEEYGHSILRETAFLITHSLLHLLGFDHMEDDERIVMEKHQEAILDSVNITRENG